MHAQLLQLCPTICNTIGIACQASLFIGFFKQEYWSGLPCPPPGKRNVGNYIQNLIIIYSVK